MHGIIYNKYYKDSFSSNFSLGLRFVDESVPFCIDLFRGVIHRPAMGAAHLPRCGIIARQMNLNTPTAYPGHPTYVVVLPSVSISSRSVLPCPVKRCWPPLCGLTGGSLPPQHRGSLAPPNPLPPPVIIVLRPE